MECLADWLTGFRAIGLAGCTRTKRVFCRSNARRTHGPCRVTLADRAPTAHECIPDNTTANNVMRQASQQTVAAELLSGRFTLSEAT